MNRLKGKVALITGAARPRGMGYATAKLFAEEGAVVILADIREEVLDRVKELQATGYRAVGFKADLTKSSEVNETIKKTRDQFGKIDILCNVAGGSVPPRPSFTDMSEEYWDTVIDRNLKTTFNCCKAVVPGMIEQRYGKIVNWASVTGTKTAYLYSAAYAASKGAVSGLTRALAQELGRYDITVNAIIPGFIDTSDKPQDLSFPDNPIPRPGTTEECASLALFLATDESSYITGAEMVLDGGTTIVEWIAPAALKLLFPPKSLQS